MTDQIHPPFPDQNMRPPGRESNMNPQPRFTGAAYRPADKLKNRTALITGGDSGIGRSVATLFAREGADVAIIYLPEEQADAETTARHIQDAGRQALLIPGDVADPAFCEQAVARTVDTLGGVDVLVNNAAYQRHRDSLDGVSIEQWDTTFRTNVFGYFYMAKFAVPHMPPGSAIKKSSLARRTVTDRAGPASAAEEGVRERSRTSSDCSRSLTSPTELSTLPALRTSPTSALSIGAVGCSAASPPAASLLYRYCSGPSDANCSGLADAFHQRRFGVR